MAGTPFNADMSHLTPAEKRIIENVMLRHKQLEEQDHKIIMQKQDEVQTLEASIRALSANYKKAGVELNATCHVCLKTKFADGIGHTCNYCNIRCCARCSGKVTLRSNKTIWTCILCRKKQELLSKTGQWMSKSGCLSGTDSAVLQRMQEDMHGIYSPGLVDQTQDKRPKLERAHSAAEKENVPLVQRSGSLLRRQYSQQEQGSARRMSSNDNGMEMMSTSHARNLPVPHVVVGSYPMQQTPRHPAAYPEDDPNLYRGEIDGLMRIQNYQRQRGYYQDQNSDIPMNYGQTTMEGGMNAGTGAGTRGIHQDRLLHPSQGSQANVCMEGNLQQQRSFSSSEEERSTPECVSDERDESEKMTRIVMDMMVPEAVQGTAIVSRRNITQYQWKQKHKSKSGPQQPHHKDLYNARRKKPSVLVTSPGSPDFHGQNRARFNKQGPNSNIGGNLQVKLGYDRVALQLIVTVICATGLVPRSNGQPRNPYAKLFLHPEKSENTKNRTKTIANTNDPRWNQTFVYNGIKSSDLGKRTLEICVWDYDVGRYDTNDFLGEVTIDLAVCPLDEEPEWYPLTGHEDRRHFGRYPELDGVVMTPVDCHLSPPSTTSRLSDSDTSEYDITDCDASRDQRRTADGASISSVGSSSSHYSSPPAEREVCSDREHRSRKDMSIQGRKRAAPMISREITISSYPVYPKDEMHQSLMGHRSHSAAPMSSSNVRYRGRSQSPSGHRSVSPPERRSIFYSHAYVPTRFGSRSATATPVGSPKKRQLPQIPVALRERVAHEFDERGRLLRHRTKPTNIMYRSTGTGGWERHYSGRSDSDLPSMSHESLSFSHNATQRIYRSQRGHVSPDLGDSDIESIASVPSSAFSTQSERPRSSKGLIPTVKSVLIPGVIFPQPPPPRRNRRRHRLRVPCSECHCPNNNDNPVKLKNNNHPSKHNSLSHPLVRSKSAVVRSLYKKMRTPFTRSHTVDENMLRYYSPQTSEYSVCESYMLKPEDLRASTRRNRIPEIYVEDCLEIDFNDRLINKFNENRLSPYITNSSDGEYYLAASNNITNDNNFSFRPFRPALFSKTRSFDYNTRADISPLPTRPLQRRANSFEYRPIAGNIFSDDSIRTARRKLKRTFRLSDDNYADKILAIADRSKSYYDSNDDDKFAKKIFRDRIRMDDDDDDDEALAFDTGIYHDNNYNDLSDSNNDNDYSTIDELRNFYDREPNVDEFYRDADDVYGVGCVDVDTVEYENLRRRDDFQDDGAFSKGRSALERAESTPILHPNRCDDYRRRRNLSCPETRDWTASESMDLESGSDFGSMETVVMSADYTRRKNNFKDIENRMKACFESDENDRASNTNREYPLTTSASVAGKSNSSGRNRYCRRNSSCPEARELELMSREGGTRQSRSLERRHRRKQSMEIDRERHGHQASSKRNVAISEKLEYFEYSMESESQCSENCRFGPCDPRSTRNLAPRPGNANSDLFDSQTATSDTANDHRRDSIIDGHHHDNRHQRHHHNDEQHQQQHGKTSSSLSNLHNERRSFSVTESSTDYASQSSTYDKTLRNQVTDNGHGDHGNHSNHGNHGKRGQFTRSLSNADVPPDEKIDGSLSDTAVSLCIEEAQRRPRKSSPGSKSGSGSSSGGNSAATYQAGLGKKSNSTSQLSATEYGDGDMYMRGRVTGESRVSYSMNRKRSSTASSILRSEEILPMYQQFMPYRQSGWPISDTGGSLNSICSSEGSSWSTSMRMTGETGQLRDFLQDLGPAQVVGRQALGARCLGEVQLSFSQKKGYLEVEVVRAKDLKPKPDSKVIPAAYVKVYLVNGKKCIAKAKTTTARKTLDPFYQQTLVFKENCRGCILQVTVWGDYGRLEGKKVFMGIAQIVLDELEMKVDEVVFGWYKLFGDTSLVSALSRRSSAASLDSNH